jgi:hypothetical protein
MAAIAGLLAFSVSAQIQNARVEGTVADSSGALIPGAKLVITNIRTQVKSEAESDASGFYFFPVLQPGFYSLTAEAQGFRKETVTNIEVNVGVTLRQDVKLEVGTVTETLTVEADSVRVQTTEATIQRAVTLRDISTLPQLARNPVALATFQPGVQLGTSPNDASFARINGMRQGSNNNTLDGIDVNDAVSPRLGLTLNANNTDSIEEFRIITNGAKAEYGRNAGGTVELITRSGTNSFHGNLFEYHRNTVLNANNFFNNNSLQADGTATPRPKYIQNQFGGSFGGPVDIPKIVHLKNRVFFFYNYQGSRVAQEVSRNRTVLTPEAKSGIFRWIVPAGQPGAGSTQSYNILQNDPRHIGIDKAVATSLALLPAPNNTSVGDALNTAGYRFNAPANNQGDQNTFKTDWAATQNIRAYFRYSWFKTFTPADTLNNAEQTYPGQPNGYQGGIRSGYSTGVNWAIKPWLLNEFIIGNQESSVDFGRVRSLFYQGQTLITPNLYTAPIPTGFGSSRNSPVNPLLSDNVSIIKGKHTWKTGFRFSDILQWQTSDANIWPTLNIGQGNGNAAPGSIGPQSPSIAAADRQRFDNLYNDLLGRVSSAATTFYSDLSTFNPGTPRVRNFIFHDYGAYIQDDWRIKPNLTLNLGVRYEFFGVPYERDGLQGDIVQNAGGLVNTVGRISDLTVQKTDHWYKNDWNNFAPRFGFAWSPFKDGKTSIRGSFGVFYDRVPGTAVIDPDSTTPGFAQSISTFPNQAAGSDVRASDSSLSLPVAPAKPTLTPAATRSTATLNLIDPNFRQPYVLQMNLTIQREIMRNTVLEVGYVANRAIKLLLDQNVNQTRIYDSGFLKDFNELRAFQANGTAVSSTNNLVKIYGSATAAINAIGATPVRQGAVGAAANTVDSSSTAFNNYANAGLSQYYLRNFPQFQNVWISTNAGRSYYDSLQLSVRRQAGSLKFAANYTFSKNIDNGSGDGGGNTGPLDSYNLTTTRGLSDSDRPHTFNWTAAYVLPIGRGHLVGRDMPNWLDRVVGGWEIGSLGIITSGQPLSISSGVLTGPNTTDFGPLASNLGSLADYSGTDRSIGTIERFGGGVRFFTAAQLGLFSVPAPGSTGNSGRNTFRGPGFFDTDLSIVKIFRPTEKTRVIFRAEAYNLLNTVNFSPPSVNLQTPQTFGIISSTPVGAGNQSGARILQGALRFEF